MGNPPRRYCQKCGEELLVTEKQIGNYYDSVTGEQIREVELTFKCPQNHDVVSPLYSEVNSKGDYSHLAVGCALLPITLSIIILTIILVTII